MTPSSTVTQLLQRVRTTGDQAAFNELVSVLYNELHRIASRQMRAERDNHIANYSTGPRRAWLRRKIAREFSA